MTFTDKQIKILEAAEELIAEKGFEETTVRNICQKANINVAMISYYFGSKEKMLTYLYQYRVQRAKETFAEFAHTIKDGTPQMQVKEVIKFIIGQMFKYKYFHGFVKQEFRNTELMDEELQDFYTIVVEKLNQIIKQGISTGVFLYAPNAEDLLTILIGSVLFVIRNKRFYEQYIPQATEENFLSEAEIKIRQSLYQTIFLQLGYKQ
ncbi:MAG: TetR/AcrR family transcriptional regulator [Bergeyella cardium]|uniref:TetR/AcrR family transcriptional regulator n=1 Tax=Bergeyella cardium TaxID=1585976 RepID=UPI001FE84D3D|nr:TetR/AcrR family transcriptional regulator [Bergeyella cardium]